MRPGATEGPPGVGDMEIEPLERLEDVQEEWGRLAEPTGHPFASWEWNALWWDRFGAGRPLHSFACRDSAGEAVAILPMYVASTKVIRVARLLGYADLQSPICSAEHRATAAAALSQVMGARHGCRLLAAERLPGDQGWDELLGGRVIATHPDPVLRFDGQDWEEWLASRSRNFRQQVRRRERRLVEEHGLEFRLANDSGRLEADMETLFRLHEARWDEHSTGVFAGERGEFHREFAAAAQQRGWLRLWIAEIGDEPVAAWYGWRFAGSEWYYQAGRDQRFDDLSLGFVMLAHTVREACRDGVESYRFLAGGEDYKWRFANEDLVAESRLVAHGAVARMGQVAVAAASRAPAPIRRRITRAMGSSA